jgi:hypothetical protein
VDPKRAAEELREGFVLLPAERDQTLDPALRQIVQSQPEFAGWIPSRVCFYFSDAVQVGNRRLAERGRRYQMLGVWTMAALEQGSGGRRDLALGLYANRESLLRAARVAEVRMKEVHSVVDRADTSSIFSVKIGKTLLAWNGRQAGDSTRVAENIEESWSVPGLRSKLWSARLTIKATFRWALVGSLRVEGKGDLGEALRASPIRFMGPLYQGGGGELRFSR